jgi:hypothetical protein
MTGNKLISEITLPKNGHPPEVAPAYDPWLRTLTITPVVRTVDVRGLRGLCELGDDLRGCERHEGQGGKTNLMA